MVIKIKQIKEMRNELREYLESWPIWVSFILILMPGVLYQWEILKIDIFSLQNLSIIIFLILAFYYSIPFIILGSLSTVASYYKTNISGEKRFVITSIYSFSFYWIVALFYKNLGEINLFFGWNNFWPIYFITVGIILLGILINVIISKQLEKQK